MSRDFRYILREFICLLFFTFYKNTGDYFFFVSLYVSIAPIFLLGSALHLAYLLQWRNNCTKSYHALQDTFRRNSINKYFDKILRQNRASSNKTSENE